MNHHRAATQPRRSPVPAGVLTASGPARRGRNWARRGLTAALLVLFATLVVLVPRAISTSWSAVGRTLATVSPLWWGPLTIVWLAGLRAHASVMTACLPGLSSRRAMDLNLAGSAVGNTLPLGGAVSFALTTAMIRSWGFAPSAVTSFLLLSHLFNVLSRLLFGCLATAWLLHTGIGVAVGAPLLMVAVGLAVAVLAVGALLVSDTVLAWTADTVTRLEVVLRAWFRRTPRRGADQALAQSLLELRGLVARTVRSSWPRLSLGMAGYLVLLAVLLDLCLRGLGAPHSVMLIVAAVGIERLVTAVPVTPGGAGAAELSLVACLSAGGVSGAQALAAALLYRIFTFFAEIPVGATIALTWHLRNAHRRTSPDAGIAEPRRGSSGGNRSAIVQP